MTCRTGDDISTRAISSEAAWQQKSYTVSTSGDTGWQARSFALSGSGTHTLMWRYVKNHSVSSGDDCGWVDYIQWTPDEPEPEPEPQPYTTITYTYDFAGRRVAKAYDGVTVTKHLYDGDHILAEYDGSNNLLHKYIHGPGVDQPICMIDVNDSNATYYYHFDGLGSVVALSDASGDTVEVYEYSVFGEVAASDPNHPNRFLFTGREFDSETGLYYYRARYYNPYIGRFLQTDPAGQGTNAYTYCGNRPVNMVDPSGLIYWWSDSTGWTTEHPFDPARDVPKAWMVQPSTMPWSDRYNFYWWYTTKNGMPLDMLRHAGLGAAGLGNNDVLIAVMERFKREAHEAAYKLWLEIYREFEKWAEEKEAWNGQGEAPTFEKNLTREIYIPQSGLIGPTAINYSTSRNWMLAPLGTLSLSWKAYITVTGKTESIPTGPGLALVGGDGWIDYDFEFHGWFRNAYRGARPPNSPTGGYWEYHNGVPYQLEAYWHAVEHCVIDEAYMWTYIDELSWREFGWK